MPLTESFTNSDKQFPGRSADRDTNASHSGPLFVAVSAQDSTAPLFIWLGRLFLGVSFLAYGFQEFRYSGFVPDLGLVPYGAPAHRVLAWIAGTILLAGAAAVLTGKYPRFTTWILGPAFLLGAVSRFFFHVPAIVTDTGYRTVFFELITCCAGTWMLTSLLASVDTATASASVSRKLGLAGYWLFALASLVYGIGHFTATAYVASVIPGWIPFHHFFTWFTGIAMIAAGLALAARVWMRPAAALLGLMFFLWVVLLHAPRIAHALHNGDEWNSGFVCLTMSGCALLVAALAPRLRPPPRVA
jgi:uncharacterized membrane protein YphA (DoxX/SURF4 family)